MTFIFGFLIQRGVSSVQVNRVGLCTSKNTLRLCLLFLTSRPQAKHARRGVG